MIRAFRILLAAMCLLISACGADPVDVLLPARRGGPDDLSGFTLLARIAHISDTHVVDEESPARFTGAHEITRSAWRPYESYSTQLLDGTIRAINRIHASGRRVDFVLLTGDCCDNAQNNELGWLITAFDGGMLDPRSGPDDRATEERPDPLLDPHAPFLAQGLYRQGVHGGETSVPWYVTVGNHDVRGIGVFPIFAFADGRRIAPLPLDARPGLLLPVVLDPLADFTYGRITPGSPGPPPLLISPTPIESVADRAYFSRREFIRRMFSTATLPPGHGFVDPERDPGWYVAMPAPGLRLIGLDTTDVPREIPGGIFHDGAISPEQAVWLREQLDAAAAAGDVVMVASHHPSSTLRPDYGSALLADSLQSMLAEYPNVIAHLCGHLHRNRVMDRGSYLEIETCSTLDAPQEGRLVELWRHEADGALAVSYEMFSHMDDDPPALGEDPLRPLRVRAAELAGADDGTSVRNARILHSAERIGTAGDRAGCVVKLRLAE